MNMVFGSACGEQMAVLALDDSAHVIVKALAEIGGDLRQAVFRAEDKMVMKTRKRLSHCRVSFLSPILGLVGKNGICTRPLRPWLHTCASSGQDG